MSLKNIKEEQKNKLHEINIIEENMFKTDIKKQQNEKKSAKVAGRPKKSENDVCNKKVIIYFTENELNSILQKAGSISTSPFLKKIILDNLK